MFQLSLTELHAAYYNLSRMTSLAEESITPPVSVHSDVFTDAVNHQHMGNVPVNETKSSELDHFIAKLVPIFVLQKK